MRRREAERAIIRAGHADSADDIKHLNRESSGNWYFQVADPEHSEGGPHGYVHKDGSIEGLY
jgi:hypothetical protein